MPATGAIKMKRDRLEAMAPTRAQRRVLGNILAGRPVSHGAIGRSKYGGHMNTVAALHRRGWLDHDGHVSPAGEAALALKVVTKEPA